MHTAHAQPYDQLKQKNQRQNENNENKNKIQKKKKKIIQTKKEDRFN